MHWQRFYDTVPRSLRIAMHRFRTLRRTSMRRRRVSIVAMAVLCCAGSLTPCAAQTPAPDSLASTGRAKLSAGFNWLHAGYESFAGRTLSNFAARQRRVRVLVGVGADFGERRAGQGSVQARPLGLLR